MRLPSPSPDRRLARKLAAAAVLAVVAALLAATLKVAPGARVAAGRLDDLLYDSLYQLRAPEDRTAGEVVIVAVDDRSLAHGGLGPWPWRREYWGHAVRFLERAGARAVVFDLLFTEPSKWADEGDDDALADAVNAARVPVVFAATTSDAGTFNPMAPPVTSPRYGAVDVSEDAVYRAYAPLVRGLPSLAVAAAGAAAPAGAVVDVPVAPFRLHYYGPTELPGGRRTFRTLSAGNLVHASLPTNDKPPAEWGVPHELFRDKVVILGATAVGTYDEKASPLARRIAGVEVQATAIENVRGGRVVRPVGPAAALAVTLAGAFAAAVATVVPRGVALKLLLATLAAAAVVALAAGLFVGRTIHWLPLAGPLAALGLATVGGFAWSYVTEDRQRRLVLKQLAQYVSPHVAAQVARDPSKVLAPQKRDMTVMFTDIAGFTDLSEALPSERLAAMMNFYLGEMAAVILSVDGTIDKYIGDAIMSFWNAPIDQPDHAVGACRAALAMARREREIQPQLQSLCGSAVMTRIGINSGAMTVGSMGSEQKFNYTVLGDAVNFGSRLEGANKLYGSQILLAQATADLVTGRFLLRQLDVLRVKGKRRPMAVFELLAEGDGDAALRRRAAEYAAAFVHYQQQRWADAEAVLRPLAEAFPDDGPAAALLDRVVHLRADPPPADWDGVYVARSK